MTPAGGSPVHLKPVSPWGTIELVQTYYLSIILPSLDSFYRSDERESNEAQIELSFGIVEHALKVLG